MNAALGGCSERDGHFQRPDRQVTFHPVTDSPANHAPECRSRITARYKPALARPDIADVTSPFLVWLDLR